METSDTVQQLIHSLENIFITFGFKENRVEPLGEIGDFLNRSIWVLMYECTVARGKPVSLTIPPNDRHSPGCPLNILIIFDPIGSLIGSYMDYIPTFNFLPNAQV